MKHGNLLPLERCPHCSVSRPVLANHWQMFTKSFDGQNNRFWATHVCSNCGGVVLAMSKYVDNHPPQEFDVLEVWPSMPVVSNDVPGRARNYLQQALASGHAPSGAVMLAACAVDAMLQEKGYSNGSLYARIDKAAEEHLITKEMAQWAHEIRLEANGQRHADMSLEMPDEDDAVRVIHFAEALAQFLFVLPAQVQRGRSK